MKYAECNKIVKQMAFERAIRVDDTKRSIADSINLENMGNCSGSDTQVYMLVCPLCLCVCTLIAACFSD